MPSPRAGTVTPDVAKTVKEYKAGKVEFRNDPTGIVHAVVGKLSFDEKKLAENIRAFIDHILHMKPQRERRVCEKHYRQRRHDPGPQHRRLTNQTAYRPLPTAMSKFVKDLLTRDLKTQLTGVSDALLVNVIGLDSLRTSKLRTELRKKNIKLEVVKNSMARRATEGTPLAPAFEGVEGTLAIVWGGDDFVSLTKEIVRLTEAKEFEGFVTPAAARWTAPSFPPPRLKKSANGPAASNNCRCSSARSLARARSWPRSFLAPAEHWSAKSKRM